jgi:hypothetical protein
MGAPAIRAAALATILAAAGPGCALVNGLEGGGDDDCRSGRERQKPDGQSIDDGQCFDGQDNDCNGQTDCLDPDCSVLAACQGGDECENTDWDLGSLPINAYVDTCKQGHNLEFPGACDGRSGPGTIHPFSVPAAGDYEVCVNLDNPEIRAFVTDMCDPGTESIFGCFSQSACQVFYFEARDHYIVVRNPDFACGAASITINPVVATATCADPIPCPAPSGGNLSLCGPRGGLS